MSKKIICLLLLLGMYSSAQDNSFQRSHGSLRLRISTETHAELAQELFKSCCHIQRKIERILYKVSSSQPTLNIRVEGPPPARESATLLYFSARELQEASTYEIVEKISRKLISRSLVKKNATSPSTPPPWLVAATVHLIQIDSSGMVSREKYPLTRHAVTHGSYPDFDLLLTRKAPRAKDLWLYRIYAENCAVFLRSLFIPNNHRAKLADFLREGRSDTLSFLAENFPDLSSKRKRRLWYKAACQKICFNTVNPFPPEVLQKKVEQLFSVTTVSLNGTQSIPLELLPEEENYILDQSFISFMEVDFLKILFQAPETARPGLQQFLQALKALKEGRRDDFKEEMTLARELFSQDLKRQQKLSSYLKALTTEHSHSYTHLLELIQARQLARKRNLENFPLWQDYLRELEHKIKLTEVK
jgi:hypothetical protein